MVGILVSLWEGPFSVVSGRVIVFKQGSTSDPMIPMIHGLGFANHLEFGDFSSDQEAFVSRSLALPGGWEKSEISGENVELLKRFCCFFVRMRLKMDVV